MMANISYRGFNSNVITIETNGEIGKSTPVTVKSTDLCNAANDGENFVGIAVCQRDNLASVQIEGYVEVKYSGNAPATGYTKLCADGKGGVKSSTSASIFYKVLMVDSANNLVGFIL